MKVVVRCIYYKAVTPSCDIIDMDTETWREFLHSGGNKRKEIAITLLNKQFMRDYIKEIAWIPLDGQNKLKEI